MATVSKYKVPFGTVSITPEARDLIARFDRVSRGISDTVQRRFDEDLGDLIG